MAKIELKEYLTEEEKKKLAQLKMDFIKATLVLNKSIVSDRIHRSGINGTCPDFEKYLEYNNSYKKLRQFMKTLEKPKEVKKTDKE